MRFLWPAFSGITAQKMKFSIEYFFSKCDQIRRKLQIWSHLLKKFLMKNLFFVQYICAETQILFLYKKIRVKENPFSHVFFIVTRMYYNAAVSLPF